MLAHATALLVVLALALSRPAFAALGLVVLCSAVRGERMLSLRAPTAPVRMRWAADHRLYWDDAGGRGHEGVCIDARSWGTIWVRLRVRASRRRFGRAIVIPFDAVDSDVHRRLRARCRVMPPEPDA